MPTYNGWVNRETWVINLHLSELMYNDAVEALRSFEYESFEDYVENLALGYEDMFNELCMPAEANMLLLDLIRNQDICWSQLATHYGEEAVSDLGYVFNDDAKQSSETSCEHLSTTGADA